MVKVPAGEFLMGSKEGEGDPDEQPRHVLYLPTFYIGKTPVTVKMYQEFLARSGHLQEEKELFERRNRSADHPALGVSWHEALAFAEWQGFGLPSEAEWEKAARGTDGRVYPWGNEWKEGLANTREYWETRGGRLRIPWVRRRTVGNTTPVGQFSPRGDSPYGCVDMAGNVLEWTRSIWDRASGAPDFTYPYDPTDGREDLTSSHLRVVRGGSVFYDTRLARCAYRFRLVPDYRFDLIGFRVVVLPFSSGL